MPTQSIPVYTLGEGFNIVTESYLLEWSQLAILLFLFFAAFTFWRYIFLGLSRLLQRRDGRPATKLRKAAFSVLYNSARSDKFAISLYTISIGYTWIVNSSLAPRPSYVILTPGVADQVLGDPALVMLICGIITSTFLTIWRKYWRKTTTGDAGGQG